MLQLGNITVAWLSALLLPLTRISAFMFTAPLFGQLAANIRVRTLYALSLCVLVLPYGFSINAPPRLFPDHVPMLIAYEAILGAAMGLVLQFVSAAIVTAGEQISTAVGIGFAQEFDPLIGPTPVLSRLLNLVGLLAFLASGGHSIVIGMLAESLKVLPPGNFEAIDLRALLEFGGIVFKGAALLAAPILLALVAVNVAIGVLSKATPSLNIFAIGFAANLLVGFGLLLMSVPGMVERMLELWSSAEAYARSVSGS